MAEEGIRPQPELEDLNTAEGASEEAKKLSRRRLLAAGTTAAAGAALQACYKAPPKGYEPPKGEEPPKDEKDEKWREWKWRWKGNTFPQPMAFTPNAAGDVVIDPFNLHLNPFSFCGGNSGQVRSYDGHTPAPTIFVDPGGTLKIYLCNNLPPNVCNANGPGMGPDYCEMNKPSGFNTTNLHFHGLHVSPCSIWDDGIPDCAPGHHGQPKLASDDVLFEIPPGGTQKYCVVLPKFHAPGTHWYHAHKHGSTALQVADGMAGALIVREKDPIVNQHEDFVWLIQEIYPDTEDFNIYPAQGGGMMGNAQATFLINGECHPTLKTHTGKTIRLRFINATGSPRGFTRLRLVKCSNDPDAMCDEEVPGGAGGKTMYLMAVDGITFFGHKPQPKRWWDIAPGNRADILLQFNDDEVGVWKVVKDHTPGVMVQATQVLGYISVRKGYFKDPDPATIDLPPWSEAPAYLQPIQAGDIGAVRTVTFQVEGGWQGFKIDGMQYTEDPDQDIVVPLGCVEAWNLRNEWLGGASAQPHPFHIHINPFQLARAPAEIKLMDTSGPDVPENWIWWDNIALPPATAMGPDGASSITMWTRFWDYPGRFVLHCHILVHEDLGMMRNVRVEDPEGVGAGPCEPLYEPVPPKCQTLPGYPPRRPD